ncbi:unnamed protein product, partial [Hapterophycus canaliculatus]
TARFGAVCFDCPDWNECLDFGFTLETLSIDEGYWRATNDSDSILACYNPDACSGGQTGSDSFCAVGY